MVKTIAQTLDTNMWVTNGNVKTLLKRGNTLYIGGNFSTIAPNQANALPINAKTGEVLEGFPKFNGLATTAAMDGKNGWIVGGQFSKVNGIRKNGLVRLSSDLTIDKSWDVQVDGFVNQIKIVDNVLYMSGTFKTVKGQAKAGFAAIDLTSGNVLPLTVALKGGSLSDFAVRGNTIFLCGTFSEVNGSARKYLAAIDRLTGVVQAWKPYVDNRASSIYVHDTTVFVTGFFTKANTEFRNSLAAFDARSGNILDWNPAANGYVFSVIVHKGLVYVGGDFSKIGGIPRSKIAAIDYKTGMPTAWNPSIGGTAVSELKAVDTLLYVAGDYNRIGTETRLNLASIDIKTGVATNWNPSLSGRSSHVFVGDYVVYATMDYYGLGAGAVERRNVAAIDLLTGKPTGWNPTVDREVYALEAVGDTIFIGGQYVSELASTTGIQAVSASTGSRFAWNGPLGYAASFKVYKNKMYIGGQYRLSGSNTLAAFAAIDMRTGMAIGPVPTFVGNVLSMSLLDSVAYIGGQFQFVNGYSRNYLCAINLNTGKLLPWAPKASSSIHTVLATKAEILVGGDFTQVNDTTRLNFASIHPVTAKLLPLNPLDRRGIVKDLKIVGDELFIGGGIQTSSNPAVGDIGLVNLKTRSFKKLAVSPNLSVSCMWPTDNSLYIGGYFSKIDSVYFSCLAAINGLKCNIALPSVDTKVTVCENVPVEIVATEGDIYKLYDEINTPNAISSGSAVFIPRLSESSIFYISRYKACESDRIAIEVDVINKPIKPSFKQFASSVCVPTSPVLYEVYDQQGPVIYEWTIVPSVAGSVASTNAHGLIQWSSSYNGSAVVVISALNSCGKSERSDSLKVLINRPIVDLGSLYGETALCLNAENTTYVLNESDGNSSKSYHWSITPHDAGLIYSTGNQLEVDWMETFSGKAIISVSGRNECDPEAILSVAVNIDICTDTENENQRVTVSVSPNPSTGIVNIYIPEVHFGTSFYELLTINGSVFKTGTFVSDNTQLDINAKGIYVLKVIHNDAVYMHKLVVN
jgi:hypothetical protein